MWLGIGIALYVTGTCLQLTHNSGDLSFLAVFLIPLMASAGIAITAASGMSTTDRIKKLEKEIEFLKNRKGGEKDETDSRKIL